MSADNAFEGINESKTNMDYIYNQSDPRTYFRELKKLTYTIPDSAKPIFQKLIIHLQQRQERTVHVLDLGCSYGVNAAMLKYDLSMHELYDHWNDQSLVQAAPEDVVAHDRRFIDNFDEQEDILVTGLDPAKSAIVFAKESGLLDEGLAVNLEVSSLSNTATEILADVDLVTSTGCVSYMTGRRFERLLPAVTQGQLPWLGNFVLRMFPFDAIEETLTKWGYVIERLVDRTFVQRNFASVNEQEQVLEQLRDGGIEPTSGEVEGQLLPEFYLSRPTADAVDVLIERLLQA